MKPQILLRSGIRFYSKPSRKHRSYTSVTTELNISNEFITILSKKKPIEQLVPFLSHKLITSIIKGRQRLHPI
ncbi:hypothetical protein BRARA_G03671 [Brassica rapa]|uniref:Uncharacterized protein n=1 Tax=Brassica campestris TaxID=3711 RepID=A0A397YSX0_BRACM|nr:hypothetical protein BRARA_G03671 [Brassica rapa]CAG7905005.1 unnamed protein product [Brassica rapa]